MEHQPAGNIRTLVKDIEMTRGRHKDSREQLMLRGTLRKDRDRPSSTIGTPIKLEEIGQKCQVSGLQGANQRTRRIYWAAVKRVAALGMMQETFCQGLFLWARDVDMLLDAERLLDEGLIIKQGKKTTTTKTFPDGTVEVKEIDERLDLPNPAFKQHMTLQDKILKIGSLYGFSPSDIQRIKMQADDTKMTGVKAIFERLTVMDESEDAEEQ